MVGTGSIDLLSVLGLIPHPLVIVTAGDPDKPGERGGMVAAWLTRVSWDPPLLAVSISQKRFTYQLIKKYKGFAIHPVASGMGEKVVDVFGSLSGRNADKFALLGVKPLRAKRIMAPILPNAPLTIECEYINEVQAGDHQLIIARVVDAYGSTTFKPLVYRRDVFAESPV